MRGISQATDAVQRCPTAGCNKKTRRTPRPAAAIESVRPQPTAPRHATACVRLEGKPRLAHHSARQPVPLPPPVSPRNIAPAYSRSAPGKLRSIRMDQKRVSLNRMAGPVSTFRPTACRRVTGTGVYALTRYRGRTPVRPPGCRAQPIGLRSTAVRGVPVGCARCWRW